MATKMASNNESDYNTDKEKQGKVQAVKRKKKFEQRFLDSWLTNPSFKPWLKKKSVTGKDVPFCEVCSVKLSCAKTALIRHSETKTHRDNAERGASLAKSQPSISGYMRPSVKAAAKMEIKICSFIAENNLSISMCENFLPFLRDLFPTDEVLKKVTLGKQKATNIIRQVLGFHFLRECTEQLQQHKFSVVIDETTDKSTTSQLAILGTFFDANSFEMKCVFVDLIELPNGKADTIYGKVKECLASCNIPMKNVIGFCADTCNVMFGKHHSVSQLFIKDCPWILPVKCSCHLIHLCSSYASQKLPKSLEDLCRNIYSHFHMSSQRIDAFREFQDFFQVEKHKILRAGRTRWLSLKMCVDRILEQYEPLKLYFTQVGLEDPTYTNESILKSLNNRFTEAYLEFLSFNLGRLASFNLLFQSEMPLLHQLRKELTTLIMNMCSDFMELTYVRGTDIKNIDPSNEIYHVPSKKVYLGLKASLTIQSIAREMGDDHNMVLLYYTHCKDFLVECVKQIQGRFDGVEYFDFLSCLHPEVAYNLSQSSLIPIVTRFPYMSDDINAQELDLEWRQQAMNPKLGANMSFMDYWRVIFYEKNVSGSHTYPELRKFICILMSFPYSNASVERVFSQLQLIKDDHRSALKQQSLIGLLTTKLTLQSLEKNRTGRYDPPKAMISLHQKMKSNADDEETQQLRNQFLESLKQQSLA